MSARQWSTPARLGAVLAAASVIGLGAAVVPLAAGPAGASEPLSELVALPYPTGGTPSLVTDPTYGVFGVNGAGLYQYGPGGPTLVLSASLNGRAADDPASGTLYVLAPGSPGVAGQVTVVDLATDTVEGTVAVGDQPVEVVDDPVTGDAYVVNFGNNNQNHGLTDTITVLDGTTSLGTVSVGMDTTAVAADPTSGLVYALNAGDNTVSEISGTTVVQTLNISSSVGAKEAAVDSSGRAYLVGSSGVVVVDGASVLGTVSLPSSSEVSVVTNPVSGLAYVSQFNLEAVTVLDGTTNDGTVTLGDLAGKEFVDGAGDVYVEGLTDVSIVDGTSLSGMVPVADQLQDGDAAGVSPPAVDPSTGDLYVPGTVGAAGSTDVFGTPSAVTTTVLAGPSEVSPSQDATYTATITTDTGDAVAGNVVFYVGTINIGSPVPVVDGQASITTSFPLPNQVVVTAIFTSTAGQSMSSSNVLTSVYGVYLESSRPTGAKVGQGVKFTAVVGGSPTQPKGTVSFTVNGNPQATEKLSKQDTSRLSMKFTAPGSYTIVATYNSSNGLPSASSSLVEVVVPKGK